MSDPPPRKPQRSTKTATASRPLIPYDLQHDGLFIVRRLVGSGWLQIGRDRAGWNIDLDDLD